MVDLISIDIEKEPYVKVLTNDKIINLTGQSGSGKSTYAQKMFGSKKYIIIDTDIIIGNNHSNNKYCNDLKKYFKTKYPDRILDLGENFDFIYNEILNYFKNYDKTIVIDCAQFHCIQDISLLKGTVIVLRTSIDTCYKRCIERYVENHPNCTDEELKKYKERKKKIYEWYHGSNEFLNRVDSYKSQI